MKPTVILTLLITGIGFIQCETNDSEILKQEPPLDWIKGVWRSDYNDSIKFTSTTDVYMNSILHYYKFEADSIKLRLMIDSIYSCCKKPYKSYKYEFDIKQNQLIIYDFYNTYDLIYFFHNPDSAVFTKSYDKVQLPFEEWIQGLWIDQNNYSFAFSRPYVVNSSDVDGKFWYCKRFVKNGIYYIDSSSVSSVRYVFTKDSLRIQPGYFSNLDAFFSYSYELEKENDLLMLFNYNKLDTAKFYKK